MNYNLKTKTMEEFPKTCFPFEIFVYPELVEEFKCAIGEKILNNPVMNKEGKSFCLQCYDNKHKNNQDISNSKFLELTPILIVKNCIEKAQVKCMSFNEGCEFVSSLKDLKDHYENQCEFKLTKCKNTLCFYKTLKIKILEHEEICEFKEFNCEFCSELVRVVKAEEHESTCDGREVLCDANCGQFVKKRHMELHMKNKCENIHFKCSFGFFGCGYTGKRSEYIDHFESYSMFDSGAHIQFVKQELKERDQTINNLQEENLKTINHYEEKVKILERNIHEKSCEINQFREIVLNLEDKLDVKETIIIKKSEEIKKIEDFNENLKREISQYEMTLEVKNDNIAELNLVNSGLNQELATKKEQIKNLEKTIMIKDME